MVLFVQLDDKFDESKTASSFPATYIVDVGYGHHALARPILLEEGIVVRGSAPPEEHRLVRDHHPEFSLESSHAQAGGHASASDLGLEWRLEFRCGSHQPNWHVLYQFSTAEAYGVDYDAQNFAISQRHSAGPFWVTVICVKQFFVEHEDVPPVATRAQKSASAHDSDKSDEYKFSADSSIGRFILNGTRIDRRIGDRSETIAVVHSDLERIKALKNWFGIDLSEDDVRWIRGRAAELTN